MPLAGGTTDKFGNRYEGRWTVFCMLDVLEEKAHSIRLEPPGADGEGVEFFVNRGGAKEYHQVKRQRSAGPWTINALAKDGVLQHFASKRRDQNVDCVFVTTTTSGQLNELNDRAKRAANWQQFDAEFLDSQVWRKEFNQVRISLGNPLPNVAYEYLRHVSEEGITETFLRTTVESRILPLIEGEPANVVDVLAQLALDRVNQELTAIDIWHHLIERGFRRRRWGEDPHVLAAVETANRRFVDVLRNQAIGGNVLIRKETQAINCLLEDTIGKSGILISGEAGVGKSGVVFQVVEGLIGRGVPVVAFRVDRLQPTYLPDNVGEQMGLPGSPANVLAAISQDNRSVLVIDQLDAVSLASGRNVELFDCVNEIILQAQAHKNMRIVLACRKFDLDNDHRLRALVSPNGIADTVTVDRLPPEIVREVVASLGLEAKLLNQKQLELLSVPLHLKLLSELNGIEEIQGLNFQTAQDLYASFWKYKQQVIGRRNGRPVQWIEVLETLCDYMHEQQVLAAPEALLDKWKSDADAMASEHVLVLDDKRYAFFHEGFFDYAYARLFAASNQGLLELLTGDEQGLFRRAQVRQILVYLREADFHKYLAYLREVLESNEVRFHIKQVIFAVLADLQDPTPEEWDILSEFMARDFENPVTRQAWSVLRRSLPWFQLVDFLGLVEQWLEDREEEFLSQIMGLLWSAQENCADRVAQLVEPYVGQSDTWNNRMRWLAERTRWDRGRPFIDLILKMIDEGVLDDVGKLGGYPGDLLSKVYQFASAHGEWGCEVIGHYFSRQRSLCLLAGQSNPFDDSHGTIPDSQLADEVLTKCAESAPAAFINEIFPFLLAVIEDTAEPEYEGLRRDPNWQYRFFQSGFGIDAALLKATEIALSEWAKQAPESCISFLRPHFESEFETVHYLLLRTFASNGRIFAVEGAEHLCQSPEYLNVGYVSDPYWVSKEAIQALSPHCPEKQLVNLEDLLLSYYSSWERSAEGRYQSGRAQFILLTGISVERRSEKVQKRLQELSRKFGRPEPKAPLPMKAQRVVSPIDDASAAKMTDAQWLSAITRYSDEQSRFQMGREFIGGARELSRTLEGQAKSDPERFSRLALRFPDGTNVAYFEAILKGLTEVSVSANTIIPVCLRCQEIDDDQMGKYICDSIASVANQNIPVAAMELVAWYATDDPDPSQELWREVGPHGQRFGNILDHAINTVRGRAAGAMARIISADRSRIDYFLPAMEKMVRDPSVAVRSCVAEVLLAVLGHEEVLAIKLFQELCDMEEALLKAPFVERFLFFATRNNFLAMLPILERMVQSQDPDVATAGTRQVCLASLDHEETIQLAKICSAGTESQKIGAAQVMAANVKAATYRTSCENLLATLFEDPSPEARSEASRCFLQFGESQLGEYDNLVTKFVHSQAFNDNSNYLFMALEKTTVKLPEATIAACEKFIDIAGLAAADISTSHSADAQHVIQLVFRLYQQSTAGARREDCLNLIDRLMQNGTYGVESALENFER